MVYSHYFNISESQDDFNVTDFMTSQMEKIRATRWAWGLFTWLKGVVNTHLVDISESECYAIARKIAKECNNVGDCIVLNFNDIHSSMVIRTDSGLAYFHYPTPWDTEESSVYLNRKKVGHKARRLKRKGDLGIKRGY